MTAETITATDGWPTKKEAAKAIGISTKTLETWAKAGKIQDVGAMGRINTDRDVPSSRRGQVKAGAEGDQTFRHAAPGERSTGRSPGPSDCHIPASQVGISGHWAPTGDPPEDGVVWGYLRAKNGGRLAHTMEGP